MSLNLMEAYYHTPDKYKSLPHKTPSPQKAFVSLNIDHPSFTDQPHPGNIWKRWLFLPNGARMPQPNQIISRRIDSRRGPADTKREFMTLPAVNMTTENSIFGLPPPVSETIRKPIKPLGYSSKIAIQKKQREYYIKEHLTKRDSLNPSPEPTLEDGYRSKPTDNVLETEENDPRYTLNSLTLEDERKLTRGASAVSIGSDIEFKQEIMEAKFNHNHGHGKGFGMNKEILVMHDVEADSKRERSASRNHDEIYSLMKEKEKKEIRDVNDKIKAMMQKGLSKNKSASDLKRPSGSPSKLYDKIKSSLSRAPDRNHIIVLFDEGLEFMVDYISGFDFSVRLLFERLDDYMNVIDGFVGESQANSKKMFSLTYFCVFVFLKVDSGVNQKSLEILKDIMKINRCYIIKSTFGRGDGNLQIDYDDEKITEEWRKNSEHILTVKQNRSNQNTVTFEEFQRLQNFISKRTKSFLSKYKK